MTPPSTDRRLCFHPCAPGTCSSPPGTSDFTPCATHACFSPQLRSCRRFIRFPLRFSSPRKDAGRFAVRVPPPIEPHSSFRYLSLSVYLSMRLPSFSRCPFIEPVMVPLTSAPCPSLEFFRFFRPVLFTASPPGDLDFSRRPTISRVAPGSEMFPPAEFCF